MAESVHRMVEAGIPVMGHVGLTPQSVNEYGGFRVRGKDKGEAAELMSDALALQDAGAFSIVLELVPAPAVAGDHPEAVDTDHRHRCGAPLRWAGAGLSRHHGALHRFRSQAHPALCPGCRALMSEGMVAYASQVRDGSFSLPRMRASPWTKSALEGLEAEFIEPAPGSVNLASSLTTIKDFRAAPPELRWNSGAGPHHGLPP